MVARVSHDSSPPTSLELSTLEDEVAVASRVEGRRGFILAPIDGSDDGRAELGCREVHGFGEAVLAAQDPRAPTPMRVALEDPDEVASAWLERWAEDVDQVRRRFTLLRREDGMEVTLVATLASFGEGIAASLAVESIRPLDGGVIRRSGVHPRAEVEAALALYDSADAP